MPYEELKVPQIPQMPHCLTLDERSRLTVSGVVEVMAFDADQVTVRTVRGLLTVRGEKLQVEKLEKQAGELAVTGTVSDLSYEEIRTEGGFWSKLFG